MSRSHPPTPRPPDFTPVNGRPPSDGTPVPPMEAGRPPGEEIAPRPFSGDLSADEAQLRAAVERIRRSAPAPPHMQPKVVIGNDDRQRVPRPDLFPWRVHVFLEITWPDGGRDLGTGWLISPGTVLTAGHCVCWKGRFATSVRVTPPGGASLLCQAQASGGPVPFDTLQGWHSHGDPRADVGVIFLPQPIGNQRGWMGLQSFSDADLNALNHPRLSIAGYPADEEPRGSLWQAAEPLVCFDDYYLYYSTDTEGGQSGSPIVLWPDGAPPIAVGIHHYGTEGVRNRGIRLNPSLIQQIGHWRT